ncbi:hypothetical protein AVEN_88480-1 [Araneus ventricosus]|uniref:Uncharacterized protein n=1 Tax=Araneus ventricosus TaxID=182803 RepID=A0A4Y2TRB5_ARAVE|nr:hypothetical protein AVEN_88480-1 [Araneus ventricosus]
MESLFRSETSECISDDEAGATTSRPERTVDDERFAIPAPKRPRHSQTASESVVTSSTDLVQGTFLLVNSNVFGDSQPQISYRVQDPGLIQLETTYSAGQPSMPVFELSQSATEYSQTAMEGRCYERSA